MSRKLLLGRAGSGKTHRCLERLVSVLPGPCLMLVPTYSQAEHLRFELLDRTKGFGQRVIHTFTSLAEHFGGCRLGELVPEARRDRVAEGVLAGPFGDAAHLAGFRSEFLAAVKELKEQGRPLADAAAHVHAQFPDEQFPDGEFPERHRACKLLDAAVTYSDLLKEIGRDHEDLLLATRDFFRTKPPPLDLLLVDGFHDFTPVQKEIVDLLAANAGETVVSLPTGFETCKRTAASFDRYETERLEKNHRCSGALAALETGVFGDQVGTVLSGPTPDVSLLAAASEEDEADRLARHVARSGRAHHDFLLVRRGFDGRHALYRAAFARYGIPLRFFGAEPLATGPLARALEIFLRTRFSTVPAADMLPLLRSPYFDADNTDAPKIDADEYAANLRKRRPVPTVCEPDDRSLFAQIASRFHLSRALVDTPDGDAALAHAARLISAVRQEAEALQDVGSAEAARIVLRRLPQLRTTLPDRRHDCVFAVEAKESRQWEKPVVMVAGLDASSFPRPVRQDLFLRDDERRDLADRGYALPLRERREDDERYLFAVCLSRAREQLVLSRAAYDESGNEIAASPFLDEVTRVLPDISTRHVALAEQFVPGDDAVRPADLLPIVADGLSRIDRGGSELAVALHDRNAVDRALLAWPRRLELIRQSPLADLPIDPAARLSASRIKNYRKCPYLLLQRLLHADEPRDEQLDGAVRGTIVHDSLELFAKGGEGNTAIDEVFERLFAKHAGHLPLGVQGRAWKKRMLHWVRYAARGIAEADVLSVEAKFDLLEGTVQLNGRIDRMDRLGGGELVRDYKTGAIIDAEDERQLDVYLLAKPDAVGAVFEMLRKEKQRGFVLDDAGGEFDKKVERISASELADRRDEMRALLEEIATAARAGRLNVSPRKPEDCTRDRCSGYDLCRVAKTRWLARAAREAE